MKSELSEFEKQSAFSKALNSIRTRSSLMTAVILLAALSMFYIGGRVVLVHLVRDTEQQMRGFGFDVLRRIGNKEEPVKEYGLASKDSLGYVGVAIDYYTGGFWNTDDSSVVIRLPVKVENGRILKTTDVPVSQLFSDVTRSAIWRLVFFVAIGGILFVIPIFWFQSRILLNPLTKMTREIAELGKHNADVDCPRLTWEGKDEFALLAVSVNRMLETISQRSISIAQTEARHQALIDGLPDALAVFDPLGRLVVVSKEAEKCDPMPGLIPGEVPSAAVFGQGPVERFKQIVGEVFNTGDAGKIRLRVERPIGMPVSNPTRTFEVRVTRMDEYFALAIIRDISEDINEHYLRLAAEAKVKDNEKRESLTLLAAGIAHDMNNVLTVVLSAAESADADPSGDSKNALGTIRNAVRRGGAMMRELSTFAGTNRITFSRINPRVIIDDIKVLANGLIPKNIIVDFDCAPDVSDVDADLNQFWKVLFNILKNAGEAIGDRPGHICVTAANCSLDAIEADRYFSSSPLESQKGVIFVIKDDGPGIAPDMLKRLFDPYVSSKSVGRGLGLATVRTIVDAHGGGISVESRLDRGSEFRIFLPFSKLPVASVQENGARAKQSILEVVERTDVLVVDDEEPILKTTSMLLKAMRFAVHTAKDGHEALAVARRHSKSLRAIVLDANMGAINTVRLLGSLRVSAPNVPIIVSTGSSEDSIRDMFAVAPYDRFLAKPYTFEELRDAIMDTSV